MGFGLLAVLAPVGLLSTLLVAAPLAASLAPASSCTVAMGEQRHQELSPEQIGNARIIVGVGQSLGLPERAAVIAIATAQQESRLRNLTYGDRDSLGLFQQRPSAGWGTPAQILDPVYASEKFYAGLVDVRDWESVPLTVAAQAVQRSAFPNAYAQWEQVATEVVSGVVGRSVALDCPVDDDLQLSDPVDGQWPPEQVDASGLTPRTRHAMERSAPPST